MRERWPWFVAFAFVMVVGALGFKYGMRPFGALGTSPITQTSPSAPAKPQKTHAPKKTNGSEKQNRQLQPLNLVGMYPGLVMRQGSTKAPQVALTFDDGPDTTFTPQNLATLEAKHAPATFFITGTRARAASAVLKKIAADGFEIESHGYDHVNFSTLTSAQIGSELDKNVQIIRSVTGITPMYFRPPYGALTPASVEAIVKKGYHIVLWTVDTLDWRGLSKEQIVQNTMSHVSNGSIILFHTAGGEGENLSGSVAALPEIIDMLRAKGYKLVTVRTLLSDKQAPLNNTPGRTPTKPQKVTPKLPNPNQNCPC